MVLIWPDISQTVIITSVTDRATLLAAFSGTGVGVEVDPDENKLYPDLTHPSTAGFLLSMWLESSPQAFMSLCRWEKTGEPNNTKEIAPKRWAVTMDLGLFDVDTEGSYLGTAVARILYQTWKKQERLTPKRITVPPGLGIRSADSLRDKE